LGTGPLTGRMRGRCTNYGANLKKKDNAVTDETDARVSDDLTGRGLGFGRGLGAGRGLGRGAGRKNRFRNNP
jgi:hypothetical protein